MGQPSRRAKVEWRQGELFPRVGFFVTHLNQRAKSGVQFYNGRGPAEQWIQQGQHAVQWTKLSCRTFQDHQTRFHQMDSQQRSDMSKNSSAIDDKNALQVYLTFVELTDRSVARRGRINKIFVTLNTALISLGAFVHGGDDSHAPHYVGFGLGIALALVWIVLVRHYSNLIKQKSEVVVQLEKDLPFQPYSELEKKRQKPEKRLRRKYINILLPGVFLIQYVVRWLVHQHEFGGFPFSWMQLIWTRVISLF